VLLVGQITLGAWTIWSNKAADIATAHVAVGATMLSFGVAIYAVATQLLRMSVPSANAAHAEARTVTVG
jgi:heme A synthase